KGLWRGVLRLFLGTALAALSTSFPKPAIGPYPFEASGILMFVGALFVAYYAIELLRAARASVRPLHVESDNPTIAPRRQWYGPTLVVSVAAATVVGAYVAADRARFVRPPNGVVTIGVIAPVTGPYAILGNSFV